MTKQEQINELAFRIAGAEEVLSTLVERGTIKMKESLKLLEPFYVELEKLKNGKN